MKKLVSLLVILSLAAALWLPASAAEVQLKENSQIMAVTTGLSALVDAQGGLWMCGFESNLPGRVKANSLNPYDIPIQTVPLKVMEQVRAVSLGESHYAVLKEDGTLWMWGSTESGRIGNGLGYDEAKENSWGETVFSQREPVQVLDRVQRVSCGNTTTAAIRDDGTLWMWGSTELIGCGVQGDSRDAYGRALQSVPVQVMTEVIDVSCGGSLTAAVKADGSLWVWHSDEKNKTTEAVKLLEGVKSVSCGQYNLLAVKNDGTLWAYGGYREVRLENGYVGGSADWDTPPVKIMEDTAKAAVGGNGSCALKRDGTLWTWGEDPMSFLGIGGSGTAEPVQILDRVADFCICSSTRLALRTDGSVFGWGDNSAGELGNDYEGSGRWRSGGDSSHAVPFAFGPTETQFTYWGDSIPEEDIPSKWAKAEVEEAADLGLVPDALLGGYRQNTTRAEFCALAAALYESLEGPITERTGFIDTTDEAVEKMAALGVVKGVGEGRFDPEGLLTREQAAVMLARMSEVMGHPLWQEEITFTDREEISSWALDAVASMVWSGVMNGTGDNRFSPKGAYTREQSIVTLRRLMLHMTGF